MVFGSALEGLQTFTPDRSANLMAAFYGAGGALAAALIAELYIRAFSNKSGKAGQGIEFRGLRTERDSQTREEGCTSVEPTPIQ
jgi:hypothetical protein